MCGITGYYIQDPENSFSADAFEKSIDALEKRGPDARGSFISQDARLGLGHRRLSIIDTSSHANQPMNSDDERVTMVFNGEIFNFKTIKASLIAKGYVFKTTSDTEVLLNLYHSEGVEAFKQLNGFFAVAIYDTQTKELIVVRDRYGIKPLYYSFEDGNLLFASELKALYPLALKKKIDADALRLYLTFNYIPAPHTILENVFKLMPSQYLKYNGTDLSLHTYDSYQEKSSVINTTISYETAQKQLFSLMEQSVEDRLVADVPLGTFLSGGIDSSVITALASRKVSGLNTFSVGFKDNKYFDETQYARLVAEKFKTNHHEIILSNDDLLVSLEELLDYTDEPFADSSALAVNALCKETRKHMTVCLSGDGADEVFGGYNKYKAEHSIQNLTFKEKGVLAFNPLWKILPKSRNNVLTDTFRKLNKFSEGALLDKKSRYLDWCSIGDSTLVDGVLKSNKSSSYEQKRLNLAKYIKDEKGINDVLVNDISLVLPNDMLYKVDSMSMRNSLEVRVPFLDYRVLEFALSLPESYKINATMKKRIVQDAFRDLLPKELYDRPKHGFEVPMLDWLRNELSERIKTHYFNEELVESQGLFSYKRLQNLVTKMHSNNPEDSHATVWALLVFQHWYLKFYLD